MAGLALGQPNQFRQLSMMVGLSVPLMSIAAQLPLWIARQMFGWRLIRGEENDGTRRTPLSIRDLMTATVVVALALAVWSPVPMASQSGCFWVIMVAAIQTTGAPCGICCCR